ncbi:hypothetical protein PVAND_010074 [Polypedilum vanderplanki]|uniref:Sodium channel protein Nach n=1 Tax=Polypedilum vanderplanki TaxID=319348 RepID=A0A9J6CEG7_POLVA|nr:hypothetical protein PVAND_010074 [Polypedilum vanderplanki]
MHFVLESISEFFVKVFETSSIHGFPYISRHDLHLLEKLFWILILSVNFAFAYFAFSDQLNRYVENPTVQSVEMVSFSEIAKPSFTVCTINFINKTKLAILVEKVFGANNLSEHYEDYSKFIEIVATLNYTNSSLKRLESFENLTNINNANFLEIASEMYSDYPIIDSSSYMRVMTELNMCQSSSGLSNYQSPTNVIEDMNSKKKMCTSIEVCRVSVTPITPINTTLSRVFVTNFDEVTSGDNLDYVILTHSLILERNIIVDEIRADPKIRNFAPRGRKCKFPDEYNSKYYNVYTYNFCKMDCRINRALKYCGCVPFFYTVKLQPPIKFCNITGLLCLSNKPEWFDATSCKCMKLCESIILTKTSSKEQNLMFDGMLTIDLNFPKTSIKRGVLFDFDDLLVGFGGSFALFLGLSVLCIVEILYYALELCMNIIINCMMQ